MTRDGSTSTCCDSVQYKETQASWKSNLKTVPDPLRKEERFIWPVHWNIFSVSHSYSNQTGCIHWIVFRPVVLGCAGCAMAHPDFGRSVNPISTRGNRLCPPNYYWHTQIFRLSDGPEPCISDLFYIPSKAMCSGSSSSRLQQLCLMRQLGKITNFLSV